MYSGVNDIMRLDHGPESSLGDTLLAASLKALTTDPPSAELVMPTTGCESLCANQAVRTMLLAIMPTLDDVGIALVQSGDQSHGVVIPGAGCPSVPLVVTAMEASRQVAAVAPRWVVEGAPPTVLAPQPLARASRCVSSLMTMRYRPMRMSLCRSGCGNSPAPSRWCAMRQSRLTRRPR
jgi:hypothetical protein